MRVLKHSTTELKEADEHVKKSSSALGKYPPRPDTFVAYLLQRDYFTIRDVEAVFAVSRIDLNGRISPGTERTCTMYAQITGRKPYVYDTGAKRWVQDGVDGWEEVDMTVLPKMKRVACIGSREVPDDVEEEMREVLSMIKL